MECPTCGGDTRVLATRGVIRSRVCKINPSHRFETTELLSFMGQRPQGRPAGSKNLKNKLKRWKDLS